MLGNASTPSFGFVGSIAAVSVTSFVKATAYSCWVDEEKKAEGAVVGTSFKDCLLIERGGAAREQGGKDPETHAKVFGGCVAGDY